MIPRVDDELDFEAPAPEVETLRARVKRVWACENWPSRWWWKSAKGTFGGTRSSGGDTAAIGE